MDYAAVAESLSKDDIIELLKIKEQFTEIQSQLKFFQDQLFGKKSEVRKELVDNRQLTLLQSEEKPVTPPTEVESVTYKRKKRVKGKLKGNVNTTGGLSFDSSVPVVKIKIPCKEIEGLSPADYEVIRTEYTYKIAQQPAIYQVVEHQQDVVKIFSKKQIITSAKFEDVLPSSYADVSFLANLIIDKFLYHLPLYRQHQRIKASGIKLARSSLTNYVHKSLDLLEQIYYCQLDSIKSGDTVWMDETPLKAGHDKSKNKVKSGYIWSLYGDKREVAFWYHESRGTQVIKDLLSSEFSGTLVTDGYAAYGSYAKSLSNVEHAMCWSHTRREFLKAEAQHPELTTTVLDFIRKLYQLEKDVTDLSELQKIRGEHSKLLVDQFSNYLKDEFNKKSLIPSDPFVKACNYFFKHEKQLRVFLSNPEVTLDTNHLEREIRPIAIGRKNWMFCWTEIGAHYAAIAYSLLATCKLHEVNPYDYLVDVLIRQEDTPEDQLEQMIPRNWKQNFAKDKRISVIDLPKDHPLVVT